MPRPRHAVNSAQDASDEFPPLPAPRLPSLRDVGGLSSSMDFGGGASNQIPTQRRVRPNAWLSHNRLARGRDELAAATRLEDYALSMHRSTDLHTRSRRNLTPRDPMDLSHDVDLAHLGRLDRSLDEANSQLRALLDMTAQSALSSAFMSPVYTPTTTHTRDPVEDQRQSKRRKLDNNRSAPAFRGFRYGHYGQVEPGRLEMEIVSCDGGMFSNGQAYVAENILNDDPTVYCTKGSRCNIVLRHKGATTFTLSELIIRGPASLNYSHPVREGMVFVAMDQDDILDRTAQYQIQHAPISSLHHHYHRHLNLTTPSIPPPPPPPEFTISIHHHNDGSVTTRARNIHSDPLQSVMDNHHHPQYAPEDRAHSIPLLPPEFTLNQPDFNVTMESSVSQDPNPYSPSIFWWRRSTSSSDQPPHIGSLPFEENQSPYQSSSESEDEGDETPFATGPNALPLPTPSTASSTMPTYTPQSPLLIPHAKFIIKKHKSQCKIIFNPPVSGRFLLLKMWSSLHDEGSNVDIQCVLAKGFAGPRFFPSVEMS